MSDKLISTTYTFVCDPDECDTLIEVTSSDRFGFPSNVIELTCPCGRQMHYISATINPLNERNKMENAFGATVTDMYNPNILVTYKAIENGETRYETRKVTELEWDMDQFRKLRKKENEWWGKESQLRNVIQEAYQDAIDQDVLGQIAEIFDIPLTKTIEYTATVTISGTMEVDLTDTYDLTDMLFNNLSVQGSGEVEVSEFDVYSVEEL